MSTSTSKSPLSASIRQIREEIISDVLNLYNSNPTEESFRHYAPNAQFEDPLQFSGSLSSIKSAFKSLTKIFKDSEVLKSDANIETNPMTLNLETRYEWKGINKATVLRSIVFLTLNEQEQIVRHEERWNGEPIPNAESGFFGRIKEALRHATGSAVHAMVDSEKPIHSSILEYLCLFILVAAALIYIRRPAQKKPTAPTPSETKQFGQWTPVAFEAPQPSPYPDWSIETTRPLPYRPFKYGPDYFVTMGISRLNLDDWIELDNQWPLYHREKLARLSGPRASRLYQVTPEAHDAALETMELLCKYLVARYPSLFEYGSNGNEQHIRIKATGEVYPIHSSDPLKYASLLIKDDLALMIEGSDGQYYLKAGSIVLPGFWRLEDKINMPLAQIHMSGDVPKFEEKLKCSMERFFQRMTPEHSVVRYNYFIQTDGELAWSSSIGSEDTFGIGWQNAEKNPRIEQIHFRSERQTLRRLPRSGAILFTIHPYFISVVEIAREPGVPGRLASAIRSWPDDVSHYRGKQAYENVILKYLDEQHQAQCESGLATTTTNSYPY